MANRKVAYVLHDGNCMTAFDLIDKKASVIEIGYNDEIFRMTGYRGNNKVAIQFDGGPLRWMEYLGDGQIADTLNPSYNVLGSTANVAYQAYSVNKFKVGPDTFISGEFNTPSSFVLENGAGVQYASTPTSFANAVMFDEVDAPLGSFLSAGELVGSFWFAGSELRQVQLIDSGNATDFTVTIYRFAYDSGLGGWKRFASVTKGTVQFSTVGWCVPFGADGIVFGQSYDKCAKLAAYADPTCTQFASFADLSVSASVDADLTTLGVSAADKESQLLPAYQRGIPSLIVARNINGGAVAKSLRDGTYPAVCVLDMVTLTWSKVTIPAQTDIPAGDWVDYKASNDSFGSYELHSMCFLSSISMDGSTWTPVNKAIVVGPFGCSVIPYGDDKVYNSYVSNGDVYINYSTVVDAQAYKVEGTIQVSGSGVAADVILVDATSGRVCGRTKSDAGTGAYYFRCWTSGKKNVLVKKPSDGTWKMAGNVTPVAVG